MSTVVLMSLIDNDI